MNNIVRYENCILINRGVKQGGILSPSLFNFYINDLITDIINSKIGYMKIKNMVNIIVYADDILLISNTVRGLNTLMHICNEFSHNWHIMFNAEKCSVMQVGYKYYPNDKINVSLNNCKLKVVEEFKYLGLLIKSDLNFNEYFLEKFNISEKCLYSLYKYGMKQNGLHPFSKALIFKSYCLPKATYAIGLIKLNKNTLKKIEIKQNNIVRNMVGLSNRCHVSGVNKILKIDKFTTTYYKMVCSTRDFLDRHIITKSIINEQVLSNREDLHSDAFINILKECANSTNVNIETIISNSREAVKEIKSLTKNMQIENEEMIRDLIVKFNYSNIKQLNYILYFDNSFLR